MLLFSRRSEFLGVPGFGVEGRIAVRVTERDAKAVGYSARFIAVSAEQVRRKWGVARSVAYRRLKGLVDLGLLRHDMVLHGQPGVYRATEAGIRAARQELLEVGDEFGAARLQMAAARLEVGTLRHTLMVVDLAEELLEETSGAWWVTERELRHDKVREVLEEEAGVVLPNPRDTRMPDGVLVLEDGTRAAVELERTPKRSRTYERIFDRYAAVPKSQLDEVRFYFINEAAKERAEKLASRYRMGDFLQFLVYEEEKEGGGAG